MTDLCHICQGSGRHRQTGNPIPIQSSQRFTVYAHQGEDVVRDMVLHTVHQLLRGMLLHELDECLRVDGVQLKDPHASEITCRACGTPLGGKHRPGCANG